jgi:hypothetical protein
MIPTKLIIISIIILAVAVFALAVPIIPVHSQVSSVRLTWTAPGDDDSVGTAFIYEMRWSEINPDTLVKGGLGIKVNWWAESNIVVTLPQPDTAGTQQYATVAPEGGFTSGRTYYFKMRAVDESGNVSPFSNTLGLYLEDLIPPRRIIDLRKL